MRGAAGVMLAAVIVLPAAACSPAADLIVVNRTTVALAILPGVVVPACSRADFTEEQLEAGFEQLAADMFDDGWVPAGAVPYDLPSYARMEGDTVPVGIVVSSDGADFMGPNPPGVDPCEGRPPAVAN